MWGRHYNPVKNPPPRKGEKNLKNNNQWCSVCPISEHLRNLEKYEDLEEQGRLLELPFRMTQEVYTIFNHKVVKGEFAGVYFRGIDTWFAYDHVDYDVCYHGMIIHAEDLFETKEEAEAKLKMEEGISKDARNTKG